MTSLSDFTTDGHLFECDLTIENPTCECAKILLGMHQRMEAMMVDWDAVTRGPTKWTTVPLRTTRDGARDGAV